MRAGVIMVGSGKHTQDAGHTFRRELSMLDLTMTAIGGLVGAGWLFSALTASTIAGPGALLSWVIGGAAVIILGLTLAELAGMLPEAGGVITRQLTEAHKVAREAKALTDSQLG